MDGRKDPEWSPVGCAWGTSPKGLSLDVLAREVINYLTITGDLVSFVHVGKVSLWRKPAQTSGWYCKSCQDGGFAPLNLAVRTMALPQCTKEGLNSNSGPLEAGTRASTISVAVWVGLPEKLVTSQAFPFCLPEESMGIWRPGYWSRWTPKGHRSCLPGDTWVVWTTISCR